MRMALIVTLVLFITPSLGSQEATHQPLKVYVLGKAGIEAPPESKKKALEKELKNKKKQAERARKDLEKQLKKQYGKKHQTWPEDAQLQYTAAKQAEAAARYRLEYIDCTQKDVDDFVVELKDAIVGKAHSEFYREDSRSQDRRRRELEALKVIRLANLQEEADLIIEIQTLREGKSSFASTEADMYLLTKLVPDDRLDPNRLSDIDISSVQRKMRGRLIREIHNYDVRDPYWLFELGNAGSNRGATGLAIETAAAIAELVEENHTTLSSHGSRE